MKNLEEFNAFYLDRIDKRSELRLKLYKRFMKYMDEVVKCIFNDEETIKALRSYKEKYYISIDGTGIHSNTITIDFVLKEMKITKYSAHDQYYDPKIDVGVSSDEDILKFFDSEFDNFEAVLYYIPKDNAETKEDNIAASIANFINNEIFNEHETKFQNMKWSYIDFINSDFSFKVDDKIINTCNELIQEYDVDRSEIRSEINSINSKLN